MSPLLPIALLVVAAAQDPTPERPAPTPQEVSAAVEGLERAFAKGEPDERVRAIEAAAGVADETVVKGLARGLGDKDAGVRQAALAALRFQEHSSAVDALHGAYKQSSRKKLEDKELAALILAIGQHASPSSLPLLAGGTLDREREHSTRARIRALGRVREVQAVAELIALMNKAGRGRGGAGNLFERDFRLSLWALTGTDEGANRDAWMRWWNDNKRTLELAEEPPRQPRQLANQWRVLWSKERKRDDRGDGPARRRRGDGGDRRQGGS